MMTGEIQLTGLSILSLIVLAVVYFFLITEKLNKVIVAVLGGAFLILAQVFRGSGQTSQEGAFEFISHNLDILGFVVGMMVLVGVLRESGVFEALAIWLVKLVRGDARMLLVVVAYLTLFMTALFSNIPTVLIVTPIILVLINQLRLPYFPYIFTVIVMANIGGAMTPISDPTTYYQAKTVGLSFAEVINNSGIIVLVLSLVSLIYILAVFRKQLKSVKVSRKNVEFFRPLSALRDKNIMKFGLPVGLGVILLMIFKENIRHWTGITLDNATLTLGAAFFLTMIFHKEPRNVLRDLVDWEIIFFFMGLFVVVGALEFTHVIEALAHGLVQLTGGNITILTLLMTSGSALLSTFIDNVPYNITMVGAIQTMAKQGLFVYPMWWALNLGTSIGGAGSPIAAACNVIVFGQAEKEKLHTNFARFLLYSLPLVVINSLIAFMIIWLRYLHN
ncbi:MAG: SLC13 family permease [Patescibacteria group bacterium]